MAQKNRHSETLLQVWREACRHIEIAEATETIAALLAGQLPLHSLLVYRLSPASRAVEVAARGGAEAGGDPRVILPSDHMRRLLAWCREGTPARAAREGLMPVLRRLTPPAARGDVIVGPLLAAGDPSGLVLFTAPAMTSFGQDDAELLVELIEPFAVALENDRRLHEIARLREAAEADRGALLAKLGRSDVTAPIVGVESGLRSVMERVRVVAGADLPVLLFGETGSGKEVIARSIHQQSARANGPFIRVNCGAIPPELIDSQLFGHERGSFTGAVDRRKGWFERADGGTLLLDEIGDLPLAAQVRLLRVLEDGTLERVGGQQPVHVDVRVIGATHRDLPAMVRSGEFRADLWHRLAAFPITIPPLRERPADIGPLARHFAEKAATRFGLSLAVPTAEDVRLLATYPWPGNVRELAAVIDRAALLGGGHRLEVAAALGIGAPGTQPMSATPAPFTAASRGTAATNFAGDSAGAIDAGDSAGASGAGESAVADGAADGHNLRAIRGDDAPEPATLDAVMRAHIEAALRASLGRVEGPFGAAARLNINPNTLRARMRRLNINWRSFRPAPAGSPRRGERR
jgi:hydrogenase-4 transcriptional activator